MVGSRGHPQVLQFSCKSHVAGLLALCISYALLGCQDSSTLVSIQCYSFWALSVYDPLTLCCKDLTTLWNFLK